MRHRDVELREQLRRAEADVPVALFADGWNPSAPDLPSHAAEVRALFARKRYASNDEAAPTSSLECAP